MSELWFYHLERSELEEALSPLLEKCLQRGWRALVRGGEPKRIEALDDALWTVRDESFLPHGRESDPRPERQPILLTSSSANLNQAQALFLIDGADRADWTAFERASMLFDGRDEAALTWARASWTQAKAAGQSASYWREEAKGVWKRQQ